MREVATEVLLFALVGLILLSGFFSGSETGVMSLNRYRLQHLVRQKRRGAERLQQLLRRPDRLLGVILIGNTFANILASALATVLAVRLLGDYGVLVSTVGLTMVVLIFAEVLPKTVAALYPEKVALPIGVILQALLRLMYPVVWLISGIANGVLRLFGVRVGQHKLDVLSRDELRGLVQSTDHSTPDDEHMLMGVLDLEKMTVNDSMVPRSDIVGLDLNERWKMIIKQLQRSPRPYWVVYRGDIDQVQGVLMVTRVVELLARGCLNRTTLQRAIQPMTFIPEGTSLRVQLMNFQRDKYQMGLIVDEYGDIQGLITLEDILEEIIGEFIPDTPEEAKVQDVEPRPDGSYWVLGNCSVRDINRAMGWSLPTEGPNTLSGLIIEHLEAIPEGRVCLRIAGYPMEVLHVQDKKIERVKIMPALRIKQQGEDNHM